MSLLAVAFHTVEFRWYNICKNISQSELDGYIYQGHSETRYILSENSHMLEEDLDVDKLLISSAN